MRKKMSMPKGKSCDDCCQVIDGYGSACLTCEYGSNFKPKSLSRDMVAILKGTIESSIEYSIKLEARIKLALIEIQNLKGHYSGENMKETGIYNALCAIENTLKGEG